MGTMGRARIAPPVAMAAETPQMEMPECERGRPFPAEFEVPPGNVIGESPVDQVGFHDAQKPRNMMFVARLNDSAAFKPKAAPMITMAVLI